MEELFWHWNNFFQNTSAFYAQLTPYQSRWECAAVNSWSLSDLPSISTFYNSVQETFFFSICWTQPWWEKNRSDQVYKSHSSFYQHKKKCWKRLIWLILMTLKGHNRRCMPMLSLLGFYVRVEEPQHPKSK